MAFKRHPSELAKFIQNAKGKHCVRARLWYAMRVLRSFTVSDLLAVADIEKRRTASSFLNTLARAGFLNARRGNRGRREETTFRLARNSGPQCPAVLRKGEAVWDFNTNTEHPVK
ncbi:MAG TPA: hypothetical protein VEY92_06125 [Pseudoxanthomonas sp.]|nr:hypothetical protein [Pseudoxanthomonas sp.]